MLLLQMIIQLLFLLLTCLIFLLFLLSVYKVKKCKKNKSNHHVDPNCIYIGVEVVGYKLLVSSFILKYLTTTDKYPQ